MISAPYKRSAPASPDARPTKRQATSSPEEGELDDSSPRPLPPAPSSPTPLKSKAGKAVPFPFKKKALPKDIADIPQNGVPKPPVRMGYSRGIEDERRYREAEDRRNLHARPIRPDTRLPPPPRPNDHWRAPVSHWETGSRFDQDRHYHHRGDRWESRDYAPQSPRSHGRRPTSRSPSSPRSRSPVSPSSTKEKHRLPPPRSPVPDTLSGFPKPYYDERDDTSRHRNSRSRDSRDDRSAWPESYIPGDDAHRERDSFTSRHEEARGHGTSHAIDSGPNTAATIHTLVSPQRPLSPQSSNGSKSRPPPKDPSPPPPPVLPPPPPPPENSTTTLPPKHSFVRIPLPKRPTSPTALTSPRKAPKLDPEARKEEQPEKPALPKENGVARVPVPRRRKSTLRSRSQELALYGRIFEGCGKQEDYDVITKLGEGTFGEVHKAVHRTKGHTVALKRILMHNEKEGMPVTALREIKILKALNHPSIVEIEDMFVVRSRGKEAPLSVYMVFPYMDHDLAGLLENERVKLSPSQIKLYMKQLLEGTEYMHRNRILHRDMKAANLLISNSGSLKIADFGLARAFDPNIVKDVYKDESSKGRERRYTNCVVTRWYRPPELLLGARQYGGEVDMWGIGCVLGEMFWRRPILPGTSDLDQLDKIWQLCGTPNQHTWPNHDTLPGCDGVKRFTMHPRRLKQTYETIGPETCDLLDKLLTCNPRERLTASQALEHDYFWTDPLPADPKTLPSYEASHEFDKRGRRHQPVGPPVQGPRVESVQRPLPAPTNPAMHFGKGRPAPPRESFRQGPPQPNGHSYPNPTFPPPPLGPPGFPAAIVPTLPPIPQQLPPLTLRPGQPPVFWPGPPMPIHMPMQAPPMPMPMHVDRPSHLPPRPEMPMGREVSGGFHRNRREGNGNGSGSGPPELNYG